MGINELSSSQVKRGRLHTRAGFDMTIGRLTYGARTGSQA